MSSATCSTSLAGSASGASHTPSRPITLFAMRATLRRPRRRPPRRQGVSVVGGGVLVDAVEGLFVVGDVVVDRFPGGGGSSELGGESVVGGEVVAGADELDGE